MPTPISKPALKRLQVLYGQAADQSLDLGTSRQDRLAWAKLRTGRAVESFNALTAGEAKQLIDELQASLGIGQSVAPRRHYRSTRDRQKLGTEGRHDQVHAETTMLAGDEEVLVKLGDELTALGWDQTRFSAWLRSTSGPNGGRDTIRTLADANRAHWALKRMRMRQDNRRIAA